MITKATVHLLKYNKEHAIRQSSQTESIEVEAGNVLVIKDKEKTIRYYNCTFETHEKREK